jgi:23S rRNA (cytidine1920-2'-O)/16S rRNA (cytidine1409-2'-O)-methyltransferase
MRKRVDLLLVERGFFESRARAQAAIAAGLVRAGGAVVRKASEAISADADIDAADAHPYVSRGGVKLAHALDRFAIPVEGRTVLDIGASTGGFSDALLKRGAARIYAVDAGRDQLHASLRNEPRLVSLEGFDARALDRATIPVPPDLIVADVSFISLVLAMPAALALAAAGADLVALVKPQFEAGRDLVGRGGIVRDPAVHAAACDRVSAFVEGAGWSVRGLTPSPIDGGDGNREFLLWAVRIEAAARGGDG